MKGIVFEGGGARGAYQMGAVKALHEMGFEFDAVAGTSVGAINGVAVAQDDIPGAYEIWNELEPDKVFRTEELHNAKKSREDFVRFLKKIIEDRGIDTEPLNCIIRGFVNEDRIRSRNVIFGIVTVSVSEMRPVEIYLEDIPKGRLSDYIIASANFPLFKRARIGDMKFSDGGLYNNYPINMLINRGVKDIVSVRTFSLGVIRNFDLGDCKLTKIEPREKLGHILDFSKERIGRNLKLGYCDAYKAIKKYSGSIYYLENDLDEEYFHRKLFSIDPEKLTSLAGSMGTENSDPRRFLFETLIPKVSEYLDLGRDAGYRDIILQIFELLAAEKGIERFRTYRCSEFLRMVAADYREAESPDILKHLPGFLARNDLLPNKTY